MSDNSQRIEGLAAWRFCVVYSGLFLVDTITIFSFTLTEVSGQLTQSMLFPPESGICAHSSLIPPTGIKGTKQSRRQNCEISPFYQSHRHRDTCYRGKWHCMDQNRYSCSFQPAITQCIDGYDYWKEINSPKTIISLTGNTRSWEKIYF